mmetsp:Transcript_15648/g.48959  ORF Transcript_15648/g.48959 Transcript_15648/m.48959 type:complete len:457 (-) Transcript_15648:42-1412(-)
MLGRALAGLAAVAAGLPVFIYDEVTLHALLEGPGAPEVSFPPGLVYQYRRVMDSERLGKMTKILHPDHDYAPFQIAAGLRTTLLGDSRFELVKNVDDAEIVIVAIWELGFCNVTSIKTVVFETHMGLRAEYEFCPVMVKVYENLVATPRFRRRNGTDYVINSEFVGFKSYSMTKRTLSYVAPDFSPTYFMPAALYENAIFLQVEDIRSLEQRRKSRTLLVPYYIPQSKWQIPPADVARKDSLVGYAGSVITLVGNLCDACKTAWEPSLVRKSVLDQLKCGCARTEDVDCILVNFDEFTDEHGRHDRDKLEAKLPQHPAVIMKTSIFCPSPRGDTASTRRLFGAIQALCIPVVISDALELPFPDQFPWDDMIVSFPERSVLTDQIDVFEALYNITDEEVRYKQSLLLQHRDKLLFDHSGVGHATRHILTEILNYARDLDEEDDDDVQPGSALTPARS